MLLLLIGIGWIGDKDKFIHATGDIMVIFGMIIFLSRPPTTRHTIYTDHLTISDKDGVNQLVLAFASDGQTSLRLTSGAVARLEALVDTDKDTRLILRDSNGETVWTCPEQE